MDNNKSVYENDRHDDNVLSSIFVMIMALIIIFTTTNDIYIEQLSLTIDSFIFKELEILFVVGTTVSFYNDDLYFIQRIIYICWSIAIYFEFVLLQDYFYLGVIILIIMILSVTSQLYEWLSHTTKETFWYAFDETISGIVMSTFFLSAIAFGCDIGFNTFHAIINDSAYQEQTKEYREFFDELEEVFLSDNDVKEQLICCEDVNVSIEKDFLI